MMQASLTTDVVVGIMVAMVVSTIVAVAAVLGIRLPDALSHHMGVIYCVIRWEVLVWMTMAFLPNYLLVTGA